MNPHVLCAILAICLFTIAARAQQLVLVSPNLWYSQSFVELIEAGVIPLAEPEVLLLIQQDSKHQAEEITTWLAEEPRSWVELRLADCLPAREALYVENACSLLFRDVTQQADGILFLGGDDLPPAVYGEPTRLITSETNAHRHSFEISFLFQLLGGEQNRAFRPLLEHKPELPVYGFCLGLQTMNVALGGTLVQDIPSELYGCDTVEEVLALPAETWHRNPHRQLHPASGLMGEVLHPVRFGPDGTAPGTPLPAFGVNNGDTLTVLSYHHQCVERLASDLLPVAWSLDGIVLEAAVHRRYPNVLGTQYHIEFPEIYLQRDEPALLAPADTLAMSSREAVHEAGSLVALREMWIHFAGLMAGP